MDKVYLVIKLVTGEEFNATSEEFPATHAGARDLRSSVDRVAGIEVHGTSNGAAFTRIWPAREHVVFVGLRKRVDIPQSFRAMATDQPLRANP